MTEFGDPRLPERFWAKVRLQSDGCWRWTGAAGSKGYGRFQLDGRAVTSHRLSYERLVEPIPPGLQTDHLCRVPACVNPEHMELVTNLENIRRGWLARNAPHLLPPQVHASHANRRSA